MIDNVSNIESPDSCDDPILLREQLTQALSEAARWKAELSHEVKRSHILLENPGLPVERTKAYEQIGELQRQLDVLQAKLKASREQVAHWKERHASTDQLLTELMELNKQMDRLR